MPIRITLRDSRNFSCFRRLLHQLILTPGTDSLLLCSGYISGSPKSPNSRYIGILADDLLKVILQSRNSGILQNGITLVGGKFQQSWRDKFIDFYRELRSSGVTVSAYEATRKNWHAKVAMRLSKGNPKAVLIGSSNLTAPAYAEGFSNWNFESDVLIWSPDTRTDSYYQNFESINENEGWGNMSFILDERKKQMNEIKQMEGLYKRIMKQDGLIPIEYMP